MRTRPISAVIALTVGTLAVPLATFAPGVPVAFAAAADQCVATHPRIASAEGNRAMRIRQADGTLVGSRHWALAVAPNGNRVAYTGGSATPGYQVLMSNSDGSGERPIYSFANSETPSVGVQYLWSPSGNHVAFTTSQGLESTERLRIVDVSVTPTVVTFTSAFEVTVDGWDWAPDGSKVVFADASDVFDGADIWTVNANGSGATRIVDHLASDSALPPWNSPKSVSDLRWSPDGTKIAFSGRNGITNLPQQSAPTHEVYMMNANGTSLVEIGRPPGTGADTHRHAPIWSPNSQQLAYAHTVNLSGGGTVRGLSIVTVSNNAITEIPGTANLEINYRGRGVWLSTIGGTLVIPGFTYDNEYDYGVFSVPIAGGTPVNIESHDSQTGLDTAVLGQVPCNAVLSGKYSPVVPARLLETRAGLSTTDGQFNGIGMRPAGSVTELVVAGRGGVPADAVAVVLNVAVTEAQGGGFITAFPCGTTRPTAANLNYLAGDTVPNLVIAKVGDGGKVCLYTYAATHIIADVNGSFGPGSMYTSLAPARLLESRAGLSTVDGQANGIGLRPAGSVTELVVAGRGGVPADAVAVVLNVAVTETQGPGYITVFPCGTSRPTAARNLNYSAAQTVPNLVIAKVGDGGKVCLYTYAETHIVADVNGAFATGTSYQPLVPARLADTRRGGVTIDGQYADVGKIRANQRLSMTVSNRAGIPADASSVVLNIAVTETEGAGFITVYPCDSPRPTAANLNYVAGQTVPNLVVAKVGGDGSVCIYSYANVHVVIDVNGVFRVLTAVRQWASVKV